MSPSSTETQSLSVRHVSCERGERQLINDLSFDLSAGQCLHVTGANGSGKTTLLRVICGLNAPDEGEITWNGQALSEDFFSTSAFIGHKDGLKNELSAIENLRFYQQNDTNKTHEETLDNCLNTLQILECADLFAQQLSFGQRRRLSFARLLLKANKLWVLDEPFTGIDQIGRVLIEGLCLAHLQNGGMIVLTHHRSLDDSLLAKHLRKLALDDQNVNALPGAMPNAAADQSA